MNVLLALSVSVTSVVLAGSLEATLAIATGLDASMAAESDLEATAASEADLEAATLTEAEKYDPNKYYGRRKPNY